MATTVTRIQNFIDGEPADATKGRTETMVNPATAAPLAEAPLSSAEDVDRGAGGRARRIRSSACISSWEGRRPWWSSTTSSSRRRSRPSPPPGLYNAGQDCTAATRVLAGPGVYDDVVPGLAEEAKGYVLGDTGSPDTTLGPLSSQRQRERVEGFLERRPSNADGKDLSMYSLEDYTHVKHVMVSLG